MKGRQGCDEREEGGVMEGGEGREEREGMKGKISKKKSIKPSLEV